MIPVFQVSASHPFPLPLGLQEDHQGHQVCRLHGTNCLSLWWLRSDALRSPSSSPSSTPFSLVPLERYATPFPLMSSTLPWELMTTSPPTTLNILFTACLSHPHLCSLYWSTFEIAFQITNNLFSWIGSVDELLFTIVFLYMAALGSSTKVFSIPVRPLLDLPYWLQHHLLGPCHHQLLGLHLWHPVPSLGLLALRWVYLLPAPLHLSSHRQNYLLLRFCCLDLLGFLLL